MHYRCSLCEFDVHPLCTRQPVNRSRSRDVITPAPVAACESYSVYASSEVYVDSGSNSVLYSEYHEIENVNLGGDDHGIETYEEDFTTTYEEDYFTTSYEEDVTTTIEYYWETSTWLNE
ncbi:hypothetical protein RIF29_03816 [Crotalaria pallida]|uniref:DC1 domain-containing protein n=1 Tax=Crotalaria pallida TaxID=3830 RepID=A0AAN9J195_CROPI